MKVKGPLQSASAHGTFGPRLTFSERGSGQQARFQRAQKDARTSSQLARREVFEDASFVCRNLGLGKNIYGFSFFGASEDYYREASQGKRMSGYNFCIKDTAKLI